MEWGEVVLGMGPGMEVCRRGGGRGEGVGESLLGCLGIAEGDRGGDEGVYFLAGNWPSGVERVDIFRWACLLVGYFKVC